VSQNDQDNDVHLGLLRLGQPHASAGIPDRPSGFREIVRTGLGLHSDSIERRLTGAWDMAREFESVLKASVEAFIKTVALKLQQLEPLVPKGTNPKLTGDYVEEIVRGFVSYWLKPSIICSGTLYPHDMNDALSDKDKKPPQIDGIVYDSQQGPPVIHEGNFLVCHPQFCRGLVEIKKSFDETVLEFARRLKRLHSQYFEPWGRSTGHVMGIVTVDSNPQTHSIQEWRTKPLYQHYGLGDESPIFILFDNDYNPHLDAIEGMIKHLFKPDFHEYRRVIH
jgi:hypothetical protein